MEKKVETSVGKEPKAKPSKTDKVEAVKVAVVKAETEEVKKSEPKDVHELTWVEGKGWAVKRQGSSKVIKYFPTKVEGTQYILQVSENQSTRVVIRLKNGKFQKFDNAKKALSYAKSLKEDD